MAEKWRGQRADIIVKSGGAELTIGILQDVEFNPSKEISTLFGSGSIKRQDAQQTELEVRVAGTVAAWDWTAWKTLVDYDSVNDEITDSSDVAQFAVEVPITNNAGTTNTVKVKDAYTEDLPVSGDKDSWLEMDMEFIGSDISVTEG